MKVYEECLTSLPQHECTPATRPAVPEYFNRTTCAASSVNLLIVSPLNPRNLSNLWMLSVSRTASSPEVQDGGKSKAKFQRETFRSLRWLSITGTSAQTSEAAMPEKVTRGYLSMSLYRV
jgi:hypothetical protein